MIQISVELLVAVGGTNNTLLCHYELLSVDWGNLILF